MTVSVARADAAADDCGLAVVLGLGASTTTLSPTANAARRANWSTSATRFASASGVVGLRGVAAVGDHVTDEVGGDAAAPAAAQDLGRFRAARRAICRVGVAVRRNAVEGRQEPGRCALGFELRPATDEESDPVLVVPPVPSSPVTPRAATSRGVRAYRIASQNAPDGQLQISSVVHECGEDRTAPPGARWRLLSFGRARRRPRPRPRPRRVQTRRVRLGGRLLEARANQQRLDPARVRIRASSMAMLCNKCSMLLQVIS